MSSICNQTIYYSTLCQLCTKAVGNLCKLRKCAINIMWLALVFVWVTVVGAQGAASVVFRPIPPSCKVSNSCWNQSSSFHYARGLIIIKNGTTCGVGISKFLLFPAWKCCRLLTSKWRDKKWVREVPCSSHHFSF